jgi:hypothetical protein
VRDFLDVYNFTMESSGGFIALVDNVYTSPGAGQTGAEKMLDVFAVTRKLDRAGGCGERYFFDDIRMFDRAPYATTGGLERTNRKIEGLYDLVMSLDGKRLRVIDGGMKDGWALKRGLDSAGGRAEFRETDIPAQGYEIFGGINWIPLGSRQII